MERVPTKERLEVWEDLVASEDVGGHAGGNGHKRVAEENEGVSKRTARAPFVDITNCERPTGLEEKERPQEPLELSHLSIPAPYVEDAFAAAARPPGKGVWAVPLPRYEEEPTVEPMEVTGYPPRPPTVVELDAEGQDLMLTAEYAQEIYHNLRGCENRFSSDPAYLSAHPELSTNDRAVLVDWIADLCIEYKLVSETLYLSVNYLDRVLSRVAPIPRTKLQLVGMVGVFLASKYEEIYPCTLEELRFISDNAFTADQILKFETTALKALDFELSAPTGKMFLRRAIRASMCDRRTSLLANYICELALMDYGMVAFLPSTIAASSVCLALHTVGDKSWTPSLSYYTRLEKEDIAHCVRCLHALHHRMEQSQLQVIRGKYSHPNFKCVGKIPAARDLPPFARK